MPQVETSDPQNSAQNTALFVHCVSMYAQQAMIAMGKVMNPITNKAEKNMDAARFFIDMIEMLEAKTKGNLGKEEQGILNQTLSSLRLTYVEEAGAEPEKKAEGGSQKAGEAERKAEKETTPESKAASEQEAPQPETEEEPRKRFTKKYE